MDDLKRIMINVRLGYIRKNKSSYGPVAQLVRAPPCHGGGRRFESDLGRLVPDNRNRKNTAYSFQHKWGLSSAGRASALQAEGHRFEPYRPH